MAKITLTDINVVFDTVTGKAIAITPQSGIPDVTYLATLSTEQIEAGATGVAGVNGKKYLIGPDGQGVKKSVLRTSGGRVNYGQLTTISQSTNKYTHAIAIAMEKPFTKVRVAFANNSTSITNTFGPVKASVMNHKPVDVADSRNNSGTYVDVTFGGATTVTIPVASATDTPNIVWSDWIDLASVDMTDGSSFPILCVRSFCPESTGVAITVTANTSTNWSTEPTGRVLWSTGTGNGDFVTSNIASYAGGQNAGQNQIVAVEVATEEDIITVSDYGDSVFAGAGSGVTTIGRSFLFLGTASLADTDGIPASLENWAWPGKTTTNALARLQAELVNSLPSICVWAGYSTNDGSPTKSLLDAAYGRTLTFISECNKYGVVPVVSTPLINTAWTAGELALLKSYRQRIRALSGSAVIMDLALTLLSEDELSFVAGASDDGVHLNTAVGIPLATTVAASAIKEAAFRI